MASDESTSGGAGAAKPGLLSAKIELRSLMTWKVLRWILAGAAVALVLIQLVPVDRSNPPVETEAPARADVRAVLRRACRDCHSNETVWPWYSKVAPISWLVARDVHEGRSRMNLSTWNRYDAEEQQKRRSRSADLVADDQMPLWFYLPLHPEAKLSAEDKALIRQWANDPAASVAR